MKLQTCGIIGCGAVGATAAYTLMQSGLFSELILLDVNQKKARGESMDIAHGVPFVGPVEVRAGDYPDLAGCGIVIVAAGANQSPGESRIDLVRKNAAIFRDIIPKVALHSPGCILLIVTNPVDVLTHLSLQLSGFPPERVIGSGTVLDTARLKALLGGKLGVDARNIHAFIVGEHGDTELAVWSSANVSGIDLRDFCAHSACTLSDRELDEIFTQVRDSAYQIIEQKGVTCYGVGMAILRICEAIVRDENAVLPVSSLVDGHYGLHEVCLGLPCIVGRDGVRQILDFPLAPEEQQALCHSAETLRAVLNELH